MAVLFYIDLLQEQISMNISANSEDITKMTSDSESISIFSYYSLLLLKSLIKKWAHPLSAVDDW